MSLFLLVALPALAGVAAVLFGRRLPRGGDFLPLGGVLAAWGLALALFVPVFFGGASCPAPGPSVDWFGSGLRLGLRVDPLAAATLFMVTTVSLLVHVYSTGYMHGHPLYGRFMGFISFFTSAMLLLVVSDNLLFLFIAWELMGLCSYLLIGFYAWSPRDAAEDEAPRKAAMKAFLTTRVGDACLFIAIAILYATTGEMTFDGLAAAAAAGLIGPAAGTTAALLILAGAAGKSAQFPLHVWLPDAMEGPSPVSALIHAATMVAAGVYLVGRAIAAGLFPPEALAATAAVGSFTALFAASLALPARDYKKVLAYSTVSQLGFMLAALGLGGPAAGFFHLTTHGFFKALLFLGSGSVLHAAHTRDIFETGGLRAKMPVTYATMMIGALALSGFPFLSGFYSKDAILAVALEAGHGHGGAAWLPFVLLAVAAGLTAFYTFRMMILVFHGSPRDPHRHEHAHESPAAITVPLVILAVFAVASGWGWLRTPYMELVGGAGAGHGSASLHVLAVVVSVVVGLGGIGLAFAAYHFRTLDPSRFTRGAWAPLHRALVRLWWVDEAYDHLVRATVGLAGVAARADRGVIDRAVDATGTGLVVLSDRAGDADLHVVDGAVNWSSDRVLDCGRILRHLQTGRIQDYALGFMAALLLLVVWVTI